MSILFLWEELSTSWSSCLDCVLKWLISVFSVTSFRLVNLICSFFYKVIAIASGLSYRFLFYNFMSNLRTCYSSLPRVFYCLKLLFRLGLSIGLFCTEWFRFPLWIVDLDFSWPRDSGWCFGRRSRDSEKSSSSSSFSVKPRLLYFESTFRRSLGATAILCLSSPA